MTRRQHLVLIAAVLIAPHTGESAATVLCLFFCAMSFFGKEGGVND